MVQLSKYIPKKETRDKYVKLIIRVAIAAGLYIVLRRVWLKVTKNVDFTKFKK